MTTKQIIARVVLGIWALVVFSFALYLIATQPLLRFMVCVWGGAALLVLTLKWGLENW